jgi:hypothetical protein
MPVRQEKLARSQSPATADEVLALLGEVESMERELGNWLSRRGHQLMQRGASMVGGRRAGGGLHPSLWRTLVMIWCTSPDVRERYSDEARTGLLSAVESMDDATAAGLVRGLLDQPGAGGDTRDAAA